MEDTPIITRDLVDNAMSYGQYRALINSLLENDKVTGDFMKNGKWILNYTHENNKRMDRGESVFEANTELRQLLTAISDQWIWLVITEGWCGDAAQIIPAFVRLAGLNPHFDIRFILRDEHPKVIDRYLTNGGRSIPKLIVLQKESLKEVGNWGPRPAVPQQMTMDFKEQDEITLKQYVVDLHKWYEEDRFDAIQKELLACFKKWTIDPRNN